MIDGRHNTKASTRIVSRVTVPIWFNKLEWSRRRWMGIIHKWWSNRQNDYITIPGPGLPLRPVRRWPDRYQYFNQHYSLVRPRPWIIEWARVNIQRRLYDFAPQLRPHQLKVASPTPVFTLVPLIIFVFNTLQGCSRHWECVESVQPTGRSQNLHWPTEIVHHHTRWHLWLCSRSKRNWQWVSATECVPRSKSKGCTSV